MNAHTIARQATAFGFAAFVTLTMLAGVQLLASQPVVEVQMARQQPAPVQAVVVEARRDAQT